MSIKAAYKFREVILGSQELQEYINYLSTKNTFDFIRFGSSLGYVFTRIECLEMWTDLATSGDLSNFDVKLLSKIKYYPSSDKFDLLNQSLEKKIAEIYNVDIVNNPVPLAIGIITAPRKPPTLENTISSLKKAGFSQTIHVFAEPETNTINEHFQKIKLHKNSHKLGLYPNWLNAAKWLLDNTSAPYILICEDDVEFCLSAAAALSYGFSTLKNIGLISLYTSVRNVELAGIQITPGWVPLNLGKLSWGALSYGLPRSVLKEIVKKENNPDPESTDAHVSEHIRQMNLKCWFHLPSLAKHTGNTNSTVNHPERPGYDAIGYNQKYQGFKLHS